MLYNTHLLLTLASTAALLMLYLSHRNQVLLATPLPRSWLKASLVLLLLLFVAAVSQGTSSAMYWCAQLMVQAFLLPALLYLAKRCYWQLTDERSVSHD